MAWILYVLLVGTLLACAAFAMEGMLRRSARPTRWIWLAALGGIVALAILAPQREPVTRVKIPVASTTAKNAIVTTRSPAVLEVITGIGNVITSSVSSALVIAETRVPQALVLALGIIWCLLSAAVLSVLAIVSRRMNHARRGWPMAEVHGTPVRVALATGPAVVGFSRPEIVVPTWLLGRTANEQRLVIVHESEHVRARDQLLLAGGWMVAALLPWHPAVWWSLARLRLSIELDCDARVLHRGVQPRSYGTLLIDIAGQCAGHRIGALALADRTSHLERRLLAMKHTRTRFALVRTATLGAIAGLSILVACEARLPTSADVEKMDVASAEKTLVQSKMLDEKQAGNVVYTIDGRTVSAAEAHAVASNRIASVNVLKGRKEGGTDAGTVYTYVRVTTSDSSQKEVPGTVMFRTRDGGGKLEAERSQMTKERSFAGLLFIDGVRAPEGALAKISRDDIASVEVLKGDAAAKFSNDPAAANGVIRITTKAKK
jgi:beta-lactamase regulating signal transducer with metallopeptidase domain